MIFWNKFIQLVKKPRFILVIWIVLALLAGLKEYAGHSYNNYLLFKYVYFHTVNQQHLFTQYPEIYFDNNHYGPFFSLVIAPFAFLHDGIAIPLWLIIGALSLFYAIRALPIDDEQKVIIYLFITSELYTSYVNTQLNPVVTATIIFSYCFIRKEKDMWAAFLIMFGTFIKLYSIAGLAFFFFSKHKIKLISYCILWAILFFALPMAISSPEFIIRTYDDWLKALTLKNSLNASLTAHQDFSVMGLYRRATGNPDVSSLYFLIPGIFLFFVPYLKISYYKNELFQQYLLCSVLIFIVIFSSSSEGSTYIISMTGVSLWFVLHQRPRSKMVIALMAFAILLTSLLPTIFPSSIYRLYALKALPSTLVWLYLTYEMITFRQKPMIYPSSSSMIN
ncbi:MAG: glycosyltransferase family 87 protein [Cyclobacteriaceae bacterium]